MIFKLVGIDNTQGAAFYVLNVKEAVIYPNQTRVKMLLAQSLSCE